MSAAPVGLRDRLLAAWASWETHPSGEHHAREMEAASKACAEAAGVSPNVLRDLLATLRRAGCDRPSSVEIAAKTTRLIVGARA